MSISDLTKTIVSAHLEGNSRADILEMLAVDKVKQPEKVIEKALKELSALTGTDDQDKAWYKGALRQLYGKNMEISDLKSAHHVLKDMMTLDGIYTGVKRDDNLNAVRNLKQLKPPRASRGMVKGELGIVNGRGKVKPAATAKAKVKAPAKLKAKATPKRPGRSRKGN